MSNVEIRNLSVPDLQVGDELAINGEVACVGPGDCFPDGVGSTYQTRITVNGYGAGQGGSLGAAPEGLSVSLGIQSTPGIENAPFWEPAGTNPALAPLTLTASGDYTVTVKTGIRDTEFDFWEEVMDEQSTTLTVTQPEPFDPGLVSLSCAITTTGEVTAGDPIAVDITLTNDNPDFGAAIEYAAGPSGAMSAFETTVPAGESVTETVEIDTTGLSGDVPVVAEMVSATQAGG